MQTAHLQTANAGATKKRDAKRLLNATVKASATVESWQDTAHKTSLHPISTTVAMPDWGDTSNKISIAQARSVQRSRHGRGAENRLTGRGLTQLLTQLRSRPHTQTLPGQLVL